MVRYGCSPWPDACAEVALFAAAHPATTIATAAKAVAVRMQGNALIKKPPDREPVDGSAIKAGYGAGKAKNTAKNGLDRPEMARGPARYAEPLIDQHQPACKPGSVGPRPFAWTRRDGHSSGTMLAHGLEQPTRIASLTSLPQALSLSRTTRVAIPIRSCSRWGLPCRFRCRTRGALLPHLFTLTPLRSFRSFAGRFILCGTFPGVAPAGRYPAPYVDGARTFLSQGLSTRVGAAVRPTDVQGMGFMAGAVKPITAGPAP